jgi:hypothetical protein
MDNTLHGDVGKSPKNKTKSAPAPGHDGAASGPKPQAPAAPGDCAPAPCAPRAEITYTLKVLHTSPGEAKSTVLFQRLGDGEAIEISAEVDSPNLLAGLPDFLGAAMELQRALWPAQRTVSKLPSSFFPLLAEESRLFRSLAGAAASRTAREIERRRTVREAMIVRDVAWEALRDVLGPKRRDEIDGLVALHEDPPALARSMDRVADYIDRMLADPRDAAILAVTDLDAVYATALRRGAAAVRALDPAARDEPERRGLLRLIGMAYRALKTDAFMTVPLSPEGRPAFAKPGLRKASR